MIPVQPTEFPPLKFKKGSEESHKIKASAGKIGWIHSLSDKPAKFDVVIKDSLGRLKYQGTIRGGTEKAGALVNLETRLGEELDISIEGLEGADDVQLFIN